MSEQYPPPQPVPPQGGRKPKKVRPHPRRWPWAVLFGVLGLMLGSAGGSSGSSSTASSTPAPTVTVTAAPAADGAVVAAPAPAPTVTVTAAAAPAPTVTVTKAAPAPAPAAEPAKADGIGSGDWRVGTDVSPGQYRSPGVKAGGLCYADTNDGEGNINAQQVNQDGPTLITISSKDKVFSTSGCEDFVKQ